MYPTIRRRGDPVVEIGSPASVGTVASGLAEPTTARQPYIKTLMISDCSLFTMIPGFCTPVVQTRASPPAGLRTARRLYLGCLSTRRPTVRPSVRNHLGRSRQTLQFAPVPLRRSARNKCQNTIVARLVTATARLVFLLLSLSALLAHLVS